MGKRRRTRKPHLPQGTFTANITELLTDGRGFALIGEKPVMIHGALPNETVQFEYKNKKKQFLTGQVTQILTASTDRVKPICKVFDQCGGCVLQHLNSDKQIAFKQQQLLSNFQKQANIQPKTVAEPLTAKSWGYRRRARVGIKKVLGKGRVLVGFREKFSSYIVDMRTCEVLAPELSQLLEPISELVAQLSTPDRIPQVEMALGDTSLALNFRHLESLTANDLILFETFGKTHHADIYLQPAGDNTVQGLNHDNLIQYFIKVQTDNDKLNKVEPNHLAMDFKPYHFTQVNFDINQKMLKQALDWLDLHPDDEILDLFCGLGNFTLPLAQRVRRVVGIEGSQQLVDWAKHNAEKNGIKNVTFYQADLTQDTRMMTWRAKYNYNKIVIDPPRSGAIEIMPLMSALRPEKICYVSCHPATLARDINVLVNDYGYELDIAGVMDMFPHTAHVESMALLTKKIKKASN
ncbi:MAG: 23S rRNA (uracil(1939)-C(5))-methyltransferase RlmD [Ostreibacterium sp.]